MRLSAGGGHETTAKKTRRPLCHRLGRLLANDSLVDAQLVLVDNTNTPSRERGKKMVIVDVEWRVFFPLLSPLSFTLVCWIFFSGCDWLFELLGWPLMADSVGLLVLMVQFHVLGCRFT